MILRSLNDVIFSCYSRESRPPSSSRSILPEENISNLDLIIAYLLEKFSKILTIKSGNLCTPMLFCNHLVLVSQYFWPIHSQVIHIL